MKLCNQCGDCVTTCPHQALSLNENKILWHTDICQQCDTCISTCQNQSTPMTYHYHINDILAMLRKYLPFLNGVTVSGGEATLQLPFIQTLFSEIKQADDLKHLTCFIDSNGYVSQQGWQKVEAVMDGAMIDLKAWDSQVHQRLTGRDNQRVKETIQYLAEINKLYEIRFLIIPNQTDLQENVDHLAQFLETLPGDIRIRVNAFHNHGVHGVAKSWPSAKKENIELFAQQLGKYGFNNILLPAVYLG